MIVIQHPICTLILLSSDVSVLQFRSHTAPLLRGTLPEAIDASASDWELLPAAAPGGVSYVQINLRRARPAWWDALFVDAPCPPCADTLRAQVALERAAEAAAQGSPSRELKWLQLAANSGASDDDVSVNNGAGGPVSATDSSLSSSSAADFVRALPALIAAAANQPVPPPGAVARASNKLADLFFRGEHGALVGADPVQYVRHLQRAADGGIAESQLRLAMHHDKGEYVPASRALAERYYRAAAANANASLRAVALFHLGCLYYSDRMKARELALAEQCWQMSAKDGYGPSYFQLGSLKLRADDAATAVRLFQHAVRCDPLLEERVRALGVLSEATPDGGALQGGGADAAVAANAAAAASAAVGVAAAPPAARRRWVWVAFVAAAAAAAAAATWWWWQAEVAEPATTAAAPAAAAAPLTRVDTETVPAVSPRVAASLDAAAASARVSA
jgi:TPR repeat protein